ncbi:hypothetical protein [Glycomyces sp. NPDC047010]|uniref:hypothetical protein n=1 Tax=Glycomyces sp. NPDC047010 TaxID=3155023 RepID=UPI0033F6D436
METKYERLCESIADIMFGSAQAGRPVYALPDAATLQKVLVESEVKRLDVDALAEVVRPTLQIEKSGIIPFRLQAEAAHRHRRQPLETPFALPLLVLLSLAAEQMHADGNLASHNYYSRLHGLLRVPDFHRQRVEQHYRQNAELLWDSLNSWLEAWEGERGIPTAYAVGGHAYVGLPMSQAVVRQHDRGGLHEVFALEGMTPRIRISPADMTTAIDPYAAATASPLSSHLLGLWRVAAARERIVDAACLELEVWDGSGVETIGSDRQVAATRLLAFMRTFPRRSIAFNLMLPHRSEGPGMARFRTCGSEVTVPTVAGPGGSTRLSAVEGVSAVSLVGERLDGEFGDNNSRPFGRRPRRVAPLRWDDLQGAFVEVERVSFGEDSIVVAREEARRSVDDYLAAHARPGWEIVDLPGTPEGWCVYQHVQIISAPTEAPNDLLPLAPRARTSLTLRGGFALPGLLRKWSASDPPEIVAFAAGAGSVEVAVYQGTRIDQSQRAVLASQEGELLVLPLAGKGLSDGEYVVAMFTDGASRAASTALLRLRSAETPQYRVEDVDIRLVYSPDTGLRWPLTAGPAKWPRFVNGARTVALPVPVERLAVPMREFMPRQRGDSAAAYASVRVGVPMPDESCLVTGSHRFELPPFVPGLPLTRSIAGECKLCGLVKRFAGTHWAARKKESASREVVVPAEVPPVADSTEPRFEAAFDALCHVGKGSFGAFERIAAQVEGSGLYADQLLRRLETVGHVDVARGDYLQVQEWAVNASTLLPIAESQWVLVGSRSAGLLNRLAEMLGAEGKVVAGVDAGLVRVEVAGALPGPALAELGIDVLESSPAVTIAASLPRLGEVAVSLHRTAVPKYRSAEFWDTASASWQPTGNLVRVGAYRLKDFSSTYAVRSAEDVERGTLGIGNAQIVKHIANMWAGDPLVGYNSRSGSVVAPLDAGLPGLYGRVLSLCSGRAPREIRSHWMLQYQSVPRAVADIVFDRVRQ